MILAQFVFISVREYFYLVEREKLIKAILSKNLTDYTTSVIMEKEADKKEVRDNRSYILPVEDMDDEQFSSLIKKTLNRDETK
ncbi:MAG: hypothetical protein AAB922_04915 [Patescibacteria group bacterium]